MGSRQLAVVHGLVLARIQANKGGPEIYSQRCCPISYGILCRQLYDPQIHRDEDLVKDPFSKGHWAENQITWIIRQVSLSQVVLQVRRSRDHGAALLVSSETDADVGRSCT